VKAIWATDKTDLDLFDQVFFPDSDLYDDDPPYCEQYIQVVTVVCPAAGWARDVFQSEYKTCPQIKRVCAAAF
jgi:hypothetical protein